MRDNGTIDLIYIVVIYNSIVHTAQQLLLQNFNQTLHSQSIPSSTYEVSFMSYSKIYGSGHETVAVLLPGFAISW